jgi:hypothetical protein
MDDMLWGADYTKRVSEAGHLLVWPFAPTHAAFVRPHIFIALLGGTEML